MATNRDLLKEAIADAKAVKETAIANAKAALEEAFTPQLKTMFAAKLQEMEEMDEMEDKDMYEMEDKEFMKEGEDETMNEIDLEELLAELEEEEGMEDLNEAEEEEEEDVEMSDEESEEGEEEGEPLDLEDMTDEDLKSMIEDVIKDMIEAGELEAGHEGEGEEEAEETGMEDEEEVDLAELLREIEEMEEMEKPIDELFGMKPGAVRRLEKMFPDTAAKLMSAKSDEEKVKIANADLRSNDSAFKKSFGSNVQSYRADLGALEDFFKIPSTFKPSLGPDSAAGALGQANEAMKAELDEALKTINVLKSELNEINLLNAKLLYTNKIFKAKNLNENQKVKVLSSFDKAKTVGEVKMVFETLNEGIKVNKNTIKENLGSASKATLTPNTKKPIVESNDAFLRMQKLAGII
jgi:S-DNA-T family DNA segregation ATPase FtsK/SpoIIIE